MTPLQEHLAVIRACASAREWAGNRTARQAWNECERADWLLWWAARQNVDRKLLVRGACQCARRALRFVPNGELRPLQAIETAERWCDGTASIVELRSAAAAAAAAYAAADAAAAAAYAAYAAAAAAYAAAAAAYAAADAAEHIKMCGIVRSMIPFESLNVPVTEDSTCQTK